MGSLEEKASPLQIPVIDISPSNPSAPSQLLSAASKYGFVFIENSPDVGIPEEDIAELFDLSRRFFAAPVEVKQAVAISSNHAGKNHGWLSRGVEKLDPEGGQRRADVKEAFNIGEHISSRLQQPLPGPLIPHEKTLIAFQNSCHAFCMRLFRQFARALSLEDEEWFVSRHDSGKGISSTILRMLYYPKIDDGDGEVDREVDVRAGAHSDFGSITLLFQLEGQPGLEILTAEGTWAPVPVDPHQPPQHTAPQGARRPLPILINFGDLLEDWTGGLFKSTVHRVVFPPGEQGDRYSVAYFCQPLDEATLDPVPSEMVAEFTARTGKTGQRNGRVLTSRDHLMERLAATYTIAK